jgi:ferredoxin-NADP reductase
LEFLIKEVEGGFFTPILSKIVAGDYLKLHGPHGRFRLEPVLDIETTHVFIATGTGIAPFSSMIKSHSALNYRVIHGCRTFRETLVGVAYPRDRATICLSRETGGDFRGRVTEYVRESAFPTSSIFYLCGNGEMVYETKEILRQKGFPTDVIVSEVYF